MSGVAGSTPVLAGDSATSPTAPKGSRILFGCGYGRFALVVSRALDEGWRAKGSDVVRRFGVVRDPGPVVDGTALVTGKVLWSLLWKHGR